MKRCKKILLAFLAALLLIGAVPAYAANDGGLNGETCYAADFDKSVYTDVTNEFDVCNNKYQWPSSGTVLIEASGSNWNASDFNGITIPAGLVVDIYKYYKFAGDADKTYKLVAHFDTTDGNAYTIGSSSSSSTPSDSSSSGSKKFNKVLRTYTPGTPSASYKNSYDDVTSDLWCYDAVMTLTDGGLLSGYGNGKFGPNDTLTRAQLGIIKLRMSGSKIISGFEEARFDNGYKPYKDYATATRAWAAIVLAGALPEWNSTLITPTEYEKSLLVGSAGFMNPDFFHEFYHNRMYGPVHDVWVSSLSKNIKYRSSIDDFPDAAEIHQWIDENADLISDFLIIRDSHEFKVQMCEWYFLRAYNMGMFSGIDDQGTFDPYGPITRGQLCQALYNVGWTYAKCLDYYVFYNN